MFLLSSLVIGLSFIWILQLFPELWQFSFMSNWPEIHKLEILTSEFCPISGDWDELGMPNLAGVSLMKNHCMLQKAKITASPTRIRVKKPYQHWQVKTENETWLE